MALTVLTAVAAGVLAGSLNPWRSELLRLPQLVRDRVALQESATPLPRVVKAGHPVTQPSPPPAAEPTPPAREAQAATAPTPPGGLSGPAKVVDGDTLVVKGIPVRLAGIDAPETDQTCLDAAGRAFACGVAARQHLSELVGSSPVDCAVSGGDAYGRALATCRAGDRDLQRRMVADGYALAFVQYSRAFVGDEAQARQAGAGLWSGAFVAPWDWRHRNEKTVILGARSIPVAAQARLLAPVSATGAPDAACLIKGNVTKAGERIYHLPGQHYYAATRMNKGLGERWFCSEDEARAAGWRKAQR
ncbi:MAG: thermonuclease family protein [Alsobacter sp.]